VERELPDRRMLGEAAVRYLPRSGKERERDGDVEAGALLAELGRGEVDDQAAVGPEQLRRADGAGHALLRLLTRAVGQADDRERRRASAQVRFDLDLPWFETHECMRDCACEHGGHRTGEMRACLCRIRN